MCRLHEEMSRKVYSIDPTVLIPRKLYRKLSPILLIFAQGNFSFGVVLIALDCTQKVQETRSDVYTHYTYSPCNKLFIVTEKYSLLEKARQS